VPDMGLLADLSHKYELTGVTVFGRCNGHEPSLRVRSFAPAAGVPEDPACAAAMSAWGVSGQDLPPAEIGTRYAAVQGQEMGRDARLLVSVSDGGPVSTLAVERSRSSMAPSRHSGR